MERRDQVCSLRTRHVEFHLERSPACLISQAGRKSVRNLSVPLMSFQERSVELSSLIIWAPNILWSVLNRGSKIRVLKLISEWNR